MMDLLCFVQNPFDDPNLGLDRLLAFSTDHLQRMIANNSGGQFTARLAPTTAALAALSGRATDNLSKLGVRKARKQSKRTFRRSLRAGLAKIHAAVVARFGAKAAAVAECFPQGRMEFTMCTDDRLDGCLKSLVAALTAREAELGAAVVAEAVGLRTGWLAVYEASESSTAVKAAAEQARREARAVLQWELFLNLLTIAQSFPRQPEKVGLYMRQSLLEGPAAAKRAA